MKIRRRRLIRVAAFLSLGVTLLAGAYAISYLPRIAGGKYDPVDAGEGHVQQTAGTPSTPVPRVQIEPHTCGLHALESLYEAYGLNPDDYNLRYRLGTDFAAVPIDSTSTGTLHPDILRVLDQDGFEYTILNLEEDTAHDALQRHLADGHLAITVVYRSTYHWLTLAPTSAPGNSHSDPATLLVVDSLSPDVLEESIDTFVDEQALSLILIRPRDEGEPVGSTNAHLQGTAEMARVYDRQQHRAAAEDPPSD